MSYSIYKEKEFVNTSKGPYPKAWKIDKFDSFMTLEYGKGLSESMRREGPYPVFGSNGIVGYHDEKLVNSPGIVVGRKGTIGAVRRSLKDFWPIDTTFYIKLKSEDIDWNWLYYELVHLNLPKLSSADVVPGLKRELVNNLTFPLPSLAEQKKIAGVLGVVDSAIELADQVIAKCERLKRGLMQQLLTRGIGHTETKQTPIGTIPKEWQVVKLKDAVKIDQESRDPSREMPNKTFTYIDIESIEGGTGKIRSPKIILGKDAPSRARRVVHENDVIMSTVRPYLKAFAIVPKEYDDVICSTGFAVLTSGNSVLPRFLLNVLFSNQTINQCNKMMVGGQYPALNQSQVSEIEISLPPLHEQQHISGILSTVDDKLELERAEKIRFERIKRGLMDLLLTGKIRIKVD